jgi:hypothetical protein
MSIGTTSSESLPRAEAAEWVLRCEEPSVLEAAQISVAAEGLGKGIENSAIKSIV